MHVARFLSFLSHMPALFCVLFSFLYSQYSFSTPVSKEWEYELNEAVYEAEATGEGLMKRKASNICASPIDRASQEALIACVERLAIETQQEVRRHKNEISKIINKYAEKYKIPEPLSGSLLDSWNAAFASLNKRDTGPNGWTNYLSERLQMYCRKNNNPNCSGDLSELMRPASEGYSKSSAGFAMKSLLSKWRGEINGDLGNAIVIHSSKKNKRSDKIATAPDPAKHQIAKPAEIAIPIAKSKPRPKQKSTESGTGSRDGGGGFDGKGRDNSINSCELGLNVKLERPWAVEGCHTGGTSTPDAMDEPAKTIREIAKSENITTDTYFQRLREKAFEKYYDTFITKFGELPFEGIPKSCKAPEYAAIVKNAPKVDSNKAISTRFADYKRPSLEIVSLQEDVERFEKEIASMQKHRKQIKAPMRGRARKVTDEMVSIDEMIEQRKNLIAESRFRIGQIIKENPLLIAGADSSVDLLAINSLPMAATVAKGARKNDGGHADKELVLAKLKIMDQAREAMQHFCSAQWSELVNIEEITKEVLKEPGFEIYTGLQKCATDILKRRDAHKKIAGAMAGAGCLGAALAFPIVGGAVCTVYMLATSAQHLDHALHERDIAEACRLAGNAVCSEKEWEEAVSELRSAQIHMGIAIAGAGVYAWSANAKIANDALKAAAAVAKGGDGAKAVTLMTQAQSELKTLSEFLKNPKEVLKLGVENTKIFAKKLAESAKELLKHMKHDPAHAAHEIHNIEHTYAEIKNTFAALKAAGVLFEK